MLIHQKPSTSIADMRAILRANDARLRRERREAEVAQGAAQAPSR